MKINRSPHGDLPGELRHDIIGLAIEQEDSAQLRRIIWDVLPDILLKFAAKNRAYGDRGYPLGPAGQYPEIQRKVDMLKAIIWDNRKDASAFDDAEQLCDDLVGHVLMLKDCLRGGGSVDKPYRGSIPPVTEKPVNGREAHRIRESKGGEETWVAPAPSVNEAREDGVERYRPGFRGRHTYLVGSVAKDPAGFTRVMVSAHDHIIRVHGFDETRCGWRAGDPALPSGDNQCIGIEGHGKEPVDMGGNIGILVEDYHINKDLEAWPV